MPDLSAGGAQAVGLRLINQLDRNQYSIYIFIISSAQAEIEYLLDRDNRIYVMDKSGTLSATLVLFAKLIKLKANYIFTTHARVSFVVSLISFFLKGSFTIARLQNLPSAEISNQVYGRLRALLYRFSYSRHNLVLAQNKEMRLDALKTFRLKEEKVQVLMNPIDSILIDRFLINQVSPFNDSSFNFVASGKLARQKGFDILIKAFATVVASSSAQLHLYILGADAGQRPYLLDLIKDLGLNRAISLLGVKTNPFVYYRYADVFVLSSRWEGMPNVFLENYYLNTPIVATRCLSIISEMINNGVNGYLCEPDDVTSLSDALLLSLDLRRDLIRNPAYHGGQLNDFL